jgi:acetyl-CoA C-acetyltransferase
VLVPEVVLVSACRTPIGKFQGALFRLPRPELGALAIAEALRRAGQSTGRRVEEVIMGNVLQAGLGQNPARQAARGAGVPDTVGAFTINKVCGSGLKAVMLAAQAIRAGDADVIVAGGMESMTNSPYLLPEARAGVRLGHGKLIDSMVWDGLWDIYNDFHMGITGESWWPRSTTSRARPRTSSRREPQEARAAEATAAGAFEAKSFTVAIPQRKGEPLAFNTDEGIKADTTARASPSSSRPSSRRRHGDGGQRLLDQRRRRGGRRDERGARQGAGPEAAGAHHGLTAPAAARRSG